MINSFHQQAAIASSKVVDRRETRPPIIPMDASYTRWLEGGHGNDSRSIMYCPSTLALPYKKQKSSGWVNDSSPFEGTAPREATLSQSFIGPGRSDTFTHTPFGHERVVWGNSVPPFDNLTGHLQCGPFIDSRRLVLHRLALDAANRIPRAMTVPSAASRPASMSLTPNGSESYPLPRQYLGVTSLECSMGAWFNEPAPHTPQSLAWHKMPIEVAPRNTVEHMAHNRGPERGLVCLPVTLARSADADCLSRHQILLRFQVELFHATAEDVATHTRGRNIPIAVGQVGIRCRHCAHLPVAQRQKGSTYFPASILGLYQASQNMCTTHLQCGLCHAMPDSLRDQFSHSLATRGGNSGAGKKYWAQSAAELGLVDTERGIYWINELPRSLCVKESIVADSKKSTSSAMCRKRKL